MSFSPSAYTSEAVAAVIDRAVEILSEEIGDRIYRHDGTTNEFVSDGLVAQNVPAVKVAFLNDTPSIRTGASAVLSTSLLLQVTVVVAGNSAGQRASNYLKLDNLADKIGQVYDLVRSGWTVTQTTQVVAVRRLPSIAEYDGDYLSRSFNLELIINVQA